MHYTRWIRNGDPLIVQQIRGDDRARFESHTDRSGGSDACHLWTGGQCTGGYGQMKIGNRLELVHVIAWEFKYGTKPAYLDLDHECHNRAVRGGTCKPGICPHRLCVNLAHIVPKTRSQHRLDTRQWDMPRGSAHPRATLTEDQVIEIRRLIAEKKIPQTQIAKLYNVTPYVITKIKHRKAWGWLPQPDLPDQPPFPSAH